MRSLAPLTRNPIEDLVLQEVNGSTVTRQHAANAIRALSMDAVQKANTGHPGAPMGMADIAEVLWTGYLKYNPANPNWADRDRFVLSNGHGSMLIYSLLHLTGFDLSMEDIKDFRQLHSKTPGHPEYGYTPGVETTTGPLGQGLANAVGMAVAEKLMAARFNKQGHQVVDHRTWCFVGDGCLMEGISHEACSLAGTLGLGKLNVVYDDNGISIDGEIEGWFTDDTPARFEAYGWHVVRDVDGHDPDAIAAAFDAALVETSRPSIICCKTTIGKGSPNKEGTESCHGAPLGADEITLTREALGWSHDPFVVPDDVYAHWDARSAGAEAEAAWQSSFDAYKGDCAELAEEFVRRMAGELPAEFLSGVDDFIAQCVANESDAASRKASQQVIAAIAPTLPELLGGSADLAGSNLTLWPGAVGADASDAEGNYIYYGVREFAMAAMMNGITLHGGFIPYGGTFLIFMEYARNAVRMAALMRQRAIYVFTHDSVGLGEDGPTHQPVEQLTAMRSTPNLDTWRPCDAVESAIAWKQAILRTDGPSALVFSRQTLPHQVGAAERVSDVTRGGYVLREEQGELEAIIIATGSEVALATDAAEKLSAAGRGVRVVSMPCAEVFQRQDVEYRESVLPSHLLARVAVEASHQDWWYKYVGLDGRVVGMNSFGESAPGPVLMKEFGFTVENVIEAVEDVILS
ncbi:MAG: transketolase [Halieaceae bacterium MED-G26]|nr:MAG: transketolase [Halieaceae bacterium MED-G26]|tara:strand:- start:30 stop:2099 length:2070 start_codon:yes stop_codon:yes gene_type:complete